MDLSVLGREPIAPDRPTGDDVRYDPLFDQLQAEVERASLPSVAGEVDWEKVVAISADILSHKAKDLLVAGYLAVGLMRTRGVDGLALGVRICRDLIECHKEGLFPERDRARSRCIAWLLEKSEAALKPLEGASVDIGVLTGLKADISALDGLLAQLLPMEPPSLQVFRSFVENVARADQLDDSAAEIREVLPVADSDTSTGPVMPSPSAVKGAPVKPVSMEENLQQLRETAHMLRQQDVRNPVAYRLVRQASWVELQDTPPSEAGRTRLPAPSSALKSRLADLMQGDDPVALVGELEGQLGQFIFWLDLNRVSAEVLERLDGTEAAVAAVCSETVALVRRLPGLAELSFANGTPFADAATRQWLNEHLGQVDRLEGLEGVEVVDRIGGREGRPGRTSWTNETEGVEGSSFREAVGLLKGGKVIEAIDSFQVQLDAATSGRDRLLLRLAVSRALFDAQQPQYALPLLEQVVAEVENYRLLRYDPETALEGLKLAWYGFNRQPEPHFKQMAKEVLHLIAQADLGEMARLVQR